LNISNSKVWEQNWESILGFCKDSRFYSIFLLVGRKGLIQVLTFEKKNPSRLPSEQLLAMDKPQQKLVGGFNPFEKY